MRFDDPTNPAAWLLASFLALVLATNIAWFAVRRYAAHPAFRRGPVAAAGWLSLSLFYLLPPFVALQRGVISPYAMGLTEINWPATLSNGMILAGIIAAGTLFGWFVYRRARIEAAEGPVSPENRAPDDSGLPATLTRLLAVLRTPLDAALQQCHWAFYRAAAIGWLMLPLALPGAPFADRILHGLQGEPLYWGAWFGLAAVGFEWALDPFARARLRRPGEREVSLRRAALAVATTGLFVLTRNFWLCLVVGVVVETLAVAWFPLLLPASAQRD
jgi:hypothetical protein